MDRIMQHREAVMLNVTVENIGELAVVEREGRIVQREAALKLRQAVTSQSDARIVVLELSEVHAIEGGGLGMLVFLRRWARDHNIRFLLFNPSKSVRSGLKRIRSISEFYIPKTIQKAGCRRPRSIRRKQIATIRIPPRSKAMSPTLNSPRRAWSAKSGNRV
jgi:anti-anti-sigma regulatory factor